MSYHEQNCYESTNDGFHRLNDLNIASRVFILEPQWNPSIEEQAIGRISRLGQEKTVSVIRYVMQKSIEEVAYPVLNPGFVTTHYRPHANK